MKCEWPDTSELLIIKKISDCLDQGFILLDGQYRILCFNAKGDSMMRKASGRKLREDSPISSYCLSKCRDRLLNNFKMADAGKPIKWIRRFSHSNIAYEFSVEPFSLSSGETGTLIKLTDISKKTSIGDALLKSNERYELATRASYDVIWERDFSLDRYYFSEAFSDIFGFDHRAEWTWAAVMKLIHQDDRDMIIEFVEDCYREKKELFQCPVHRYVRKDGTIVWVDVRCIAIYDANGNNVRTIGVTRDISRQHSLQEELEEHTLQLQASNQELERFVYLVSHDLQEPLRMVTSFLHLLQKKHNDSLDSNARQYIHYAIDGAERMEARVAGLLSLSKTGPAAKKVNIHMGALVKEVEQDLYVSITEKNADIQIESPLPEIVADRNQMHLVLMNLVGNALKYTDGRPPRIRISCQDQKDHWQFNVQDNGIGIQPQYFERIFQLFQRLHTRQQYPGTGVGLAIVKKVIELNGGKVWVDPNTTEGSCFCFTVPKIVPLFAVKATGHATAQL